MDFAHSIQNGGPDNCRKQRSHTLLGKKNEDKLNINISRLHERIFSWFLVITLKLSKERAYWFITKMLARWCDNPAEKIKVNVYHLWFRLRRRLSGKWPSKEAPFMGNLRMAVRLKLLCKYCLLKGIIFFMDHSLKTNDITTLSVLTISAFFFKARS